MNVSSITPKLEENITIMKALEYLAFGLEPYVDDGEYLAALNRITKRTDSYFLTEKKMVEAAANITDTQVYLANFVFFQVQYVFFLLDRIAYQ